MNVATKDKNVHIPTVLDHGKHYAGLTICGIRFQTRKPHGNWEIRGHLNPVYNVDRTPNTPTCLWCVAGTDARWFE